MVVVEAVVVLLLLIIVVVAVVVIIISIMVTFTIIIKIKFLIPCCKMPFFDISYLFFFLIILIQSFSFRFDINKAYKLANLFPHPFMRNFFLNDL